MAKCAEHAKYERDIERDIVIAANYTGDGADSNNRFNELATRLTAMGANVELVTSNFSHARKAFRTWSFGPTAYRLTRLPEPGYSQNVSVARIRSQHMFSRRVARYLERRRAVPDIIFCASPPPALADVCAHFAKQRGVKLVVDVQDLWPEAFSMVVSPPWLIDLLSIPMRRARRRSYEAADLVVAVSRTYLDTVAATSRKSVESFLVYLGTDIAEFDRCAMLNPCDDNGRRVRIGYVGSLSQSYDLPVVIEAMRRLVCARPELSDIELKVIGDGSLRRKFENRARDGGVRATFTGKLPYPQMVAELASCSIAVNPIVRGSAGSVLNKACDYAAAGLPVVNTQESVEYRRLLSEYGAGLNCETGNPDSVARAIAKLVDNPDLRAQVGQNSRRMGEELFDRGRSYQALARRVLDLA